MNSLGSLPLPEHRTWTRSCRLHDRDLADSGFWWDQGVWLGRDARIGSAGGDLHGGEHRRHRACDPRRQAGRQRHEGIVIAILDAVSMRYLLCLLVQPGQVARYMYFPWVILGLAVIGVFYVVSRMRKQPDLADQVDRLLLE